MQFGNRKQKRRGFTLVEFLLYVSLSMVMLVLLGGIGVSVLESRERAKSLEEIQYTVPRLFAVLTAKVQSAETVTVPAPGMSSTYLSLQSSDPSKDPTTVDVFEGTVRVREGAGDFVSVSTPGVTVTRLLFESVGGAESPASVRIFAEVTPTPTENRPAPASAFDFYSTVTVRK